MAPPKAKAPANWDPDLECIVKRLTAGSDAVKVRQAAEVGRRAVDYFRGPEFFKWVARNGEKLKEDSKFAKEVLESEEMPQAAVTIGQELLRAGFFYRARYMPVGRSTSADDIDKDKIPKWPKKLELARVQTFEEQAFYVLCYEGAKLGQHAVLAAIIAGVLVVFMFPAWPIAMKLAVWYMSVVFLTIVLGLCTIRLVAFVFLWFCGCDFWILPNLLDEDAGFIESFIPLYSFEYRRDSWFMVIARIFCAFLTAAAIYQLGQTHSVSDMQRFAKQQFLDVVDWGVQKLAPPPDVASFQAPDPLMRPKRPKASSSTMKKQKEETFENEEPANQEAHASTDEGASEDGVEDYSCLMKCGFDTYEEFEEECISHCRCMQELVKSPCYLKCPEEIQTVLDEALIDTCTRGDDDSEDEDAQVIDEDHKEGEQASDDSTTAPSDEEETSEEESHPPREEL